MNQNVSVGNSPDNVVLSFVGMRSRDFHAQPSLLAPNPGGFRLSSSVYRLEHVGEDQRHDDPHEDEGEGKSLRRAGGFVVRRLRRCSGWPLTCG